MSITTSRRETGNRRKFWRLVWNDEFNVPGVPDPTVWTPETGFVRNREPQFYRLENASVRDGCLVLEARREKIANPAYDPDAAPEDWIHARQFAEFTSSSLTTRFSKSWLYGRVEVRAKIPHGQGSWPAIWMLGTSAPWPVGGEIDIMENWGGVCPFSEENNIHATVHFREQGKSEGHKSHGEFTVREAPWDDFHVYAIEWDTEKIEFFFDSECYFTFRIDEAGKGEDNPFRKPQYLLLNLALTPSDPPLPESGMPYQYLIDYVRVFTQM